MLTADDARSFTALAKFRKAHQGTLDLIETRIRGAAGAGRLEVVVELHGNGLSGADVEAIAELVRDKGYAVRVDEKETVTGSAHTLTVSWN